MRPAVWVTPSARFIRYHTHLRYRRHAILTRAESRRVRFNWAAPVRQPCWSVVSAGLVWERWQVPLTSSVRRYARPSLHFSHCFPGVVRKSYNQFNNVISVLCKNSNEMAALHLTMYCLSALLYGCETLCLTSHNVHNYLFQKKMLSLLERKCLSHCNISEMSFLIDQRVVVLADD